MYFAFPLARFLLRTVGVQQRRQGFGLLGTCRSFHAFGVCHVDRSLKLGSLSGSFVSGCRSMSPLKFLFAGLPFRLLHIELVKPKKELQWRL